MTEAWKPVVGYEELYEVSNTGKVWSIRKEKTLSPAKNTSGHLYVRLHKGDKGKKKYIHRLVLEAFVGACPEGMETRHLDGNPANNRIDNLIWGTCSDNNFDIVRHGRHRNARKTHCPRGHELFRENLKESDRKRGIRRCLSCERAYSYIRKRHPELRDQFRELADQYYAKIVKGD